MSEVKLDVAGWDSAVLKVQGSLGRVKIPKEADITKTTLKFFRKLSEVEKDIGKVAKDWNVSAQASAGKMRDAGQKIVEEDRRAAQDIEGNTQTMVRFP